MKTKRILSTILALALVMSTMFIPVSAATVVTDELTLTAALIKGGEVKLANNIDIANMLTIPEDVTVTLDLNGCNITAGYQENSSTKHVYAIQNLGNLTIEDSVGTGCISARGIYNGYNGDGIADNAVITVNGAAINSVDTNGGASIWGYGENSQIYLNDAKLTGATGVIYSEGYVEIDGGTYTCYSGIDDDGTQLAAPTYNVRAYNGLTIKDGTFTSRHGVISLGGGKGEISGGSYTIDFAAQTTSNVVYLYGDADLTIYDGEFLSNNSSDKGDSGAAVVVSGSDAKLNIVDGTYLGLNGAVSGNDNTKVTGGSYGSIYGYDGWDNLEKYIPEEAKENVTVANPVANVGSKYYTSLADAVAAVTDEDNTVVLIANVEISETLEINKETVLDLNGKKITTAETMTNSPAIKNTSVLTITGEGTVDAVRNALQNDGTVTIENGIFKSAATYALNNSAGKMTINDATVEGDGGVYAGGTSVEIKDGKFTAKANGTWRHCIYAAADTVTIDGGVFTHTGNTSTLMVASDVTITGGEISVADGYYVIDATGTTKLTIEDDANIKGMARFNGSLETTISGGTLDFYNGTILSANATMEITGGTFTSENAKTFAAKYIAENLKIDANGKVVENKASTEAELVAAINAGGTVVLANDITTTAAIVTSGVISTVDLNGHTLNVRKGDNQFNDATKLTIKNGTINIDGVVANGNGIFCLDEYEKTLVTEVTLDNVNVEGKDYSSAYGVFYIGASSILNVKGGEWKLSNDLFEAGGVFKADNASAILNISDAKMDFHNVRRVATHAATTVKDSTLDVYGDAGGVDVEMEHGFNRCALTVENSTINMTDMVGRALTVENGDVVIENSTLTFEGCEEAGICFKAAKTMNVDETSTITHCTLVVEEEGAKINDTTPSVTAEDEDKPVVAVSNGTVTVIEYVAEIDGTQYPTLKEAIDAAEKDDVILLYKNVDTMPSIAKPVTIKGVGNVEVNGAIAENFPGTIEGTVKFENITFNARVSTENNSSKLEGMTLKFVDCTFNIPAETYAIQGGSTKNTPGNNVLGGLYIEGCTFNGNSTTYTSNYMVYAQCVKELTVKDSFFYGKDMYKGAIHTGDSTEYATKASISGNKIDGVARGIQVGNRYEGSSLAISNNEFTDVLVTADEDKSGAIYVHSNADTNAEISISENTATNCTQFMYNDKNDDIAEIVTTFEDNTKDGEAVYMDSAGNDSDMPTLKGKGTEEDPYLISNLTELLAFADMVNGGKSYKDEFVKLTADIDLAGVEWTPIGLYNHNQSGYAHKMFAGTFDGDKHTISNLKLVDVFFNDEYAGDGHYSTGLFGYVGDNTVIKNLTLDKLTGHLDWWSGGVAGKAGNWLTMTEVHVKNADLTGFGTYIGGLVGHCYYATMTNCSFDGKMNVSGSAQVGGLLGSGNPNASNCTVTGEIIGGAAVGGIVGNAQEDTKAVDCMIDATVSGYDGVGGIIGYGNAVKEVSGNYIAGEIAGTQALNDITIGGIVGKANGGTYGVNGNYTGAKVTVDGELVDRPVIGVYNKAMTEDMDLSMFADNSWDRDVYDMDSVMIYEYMPGETSASGTIGTERDNNLVMLESDLDFVDAETAEDVVIMTFSEVTEDAVAEAVKINNNVVFIDTDNDGVLDEGEKGFKTLLEAINAAAETSDNIVVSLNKDATLDVTAWQTKAIGGETTKTITINGNGNTLTFNQLNSDWNNVATNNDAKLILNDMDITNSGHNDGPWNRHDINFACDVELKNVNSDKALAFKAGATLDTVKISDANTSDTYAIWIQPNGQTVSLTNCTIDMLDCSDGRGIKIDEQYLDNVGLVELSVKDTTFKTEEKAAILVKSKAGAAITAENVDISEVAADPVNLVWIDEGAQDYDQSLVTVTGAKKYVENQIVKIGESGYTSLAAALTAAEDDNTITLLEDITINGYTTIDKDVKIDLGGKTLSLGEAVATFALRAANTEENIKISGDVEVVNGTVDFSNAKAGKHSVIGIYDASLTFGKDVKIIGNGTPNAHLFGLYHTNSALTLDGTDVDLQNVAGQYIFKGETWNCYNKVTIKDADINVKGGEGIFNCLDLNISNSTLEFTDMNQHIFRKVKGSIVDTAVTAETKENFIKNKEGETLTISGNTVMNSAAALGNEFVGGSTVEVSGYRFNFDISDTSIYTVPKDYKAYNEGEWWFVIPEYTVSAVADIDAANDADPEDSKKEVVAGERFTVNVVVSGNSFTNADWTLVYDAARFGLVNSAGSIEEAPNYTLTGKKYGAAALTDGDEYKNGEIVASYTFEAKEQYAELAGAFRITAAHVNNYAMAADLNNVAAKTANDNVTIVLKSNQNTTTVTETVPYKGFEQQPTKYEDSRTGAIITYGKSEAELDTFGDVQPPKFKDAGTHRYFIRVDVKGYKTEIIPAEFIIEPISVKPSVEFNVDPEVDKVEFKPVIGGVIDGTFTGTVTVTMGEGEDLKTLGTYDASEFEYKGNGEAVYTGKATSVTGITSGDLIVDITYTPGTDDNYDKGQGSKTVNVDKITLDDTSALDAAITTTFPYDGVSHGAVVEPVEGWKVDIEAVAVQNVIDGQVPVTIVFTDTTGKYNPVTINRLLEITPIAVTITPDRAQKAMGEPDPEFKYNISTALIHDDDLGDIKVVRTEEGEKAGSYKLEIEYEINLNYDVTEGINYLDIDAPEFKIEVVDNKYNTNQKAEADYTAGYRMVLVHTNEEYAFFTYDGEAMFDVSDAGYEYFEHDYANNNHESGGKYDHVYAMIVKAVDLYEATNAGRDLYAGKVKFAGSKIEEAYAPTKITYDANINILEGIEQELDVNDYSATNAIYNSMYAATRENIVKMLKADYKNDTLDRDKLVNTLDVSAVKAEIIGE